jgi:hypothetical protein
LWDWAHRVRTQSINTGARGFLLGGMKEQNRVKTFYEVSPKCEGCNEICDYWHLWTCPILKETREEAEQRIDGG